MTNKSVFFRLINLLSVYKKKFIFTFLITVFISIVSIVESFLLSYTIDTVLCSNSSLSLFTVVFFMLLLGTLIVCLYCIKKIFIQQISYKIDIKLTSDFFIKVLNIQFPLVERKYKVGDLLNRVNDIKTARYTLSEGIISGISNILMFLITGVCLFYISKILFSVLLLFVVLTLFIMIFYGCFLKKYIPKSMGLYADLQSFITEAFSSIESIKTYPALKTFNSEYIKRRRKTILSNWHIDVKSVFFNVYCSFIEKITFIFILFIGVYLIMKDEMSLGKIVAFLSLQGTFVNSVSSLVDLQSGVQESFSSIKRVFNIIDESSESKQKGLIPINGNESKIFIEFKNISFSYNENKIYKDFSLTIFPGEWIGLVGSTGCGKTTLIKLLLKLYIPDSGVIFLNNMDLQSINTNWLRSKIAYIPQNVCLFAGTIIDNITMFNKDFDMEKIVECSKTVQIYEKIQKLPDKFYTSIGERGATLSGGERQKIAIARAIIKKPLLLILDEATSNLDSESEHQIIQVIHELNKTGITVVSIAHRLSTIKLCSRIIVLSNGKIVEQGTHQNLIDNGGVYENLWNYQQ